MGSDPDGYYGGVFTGSYVVAIPYYNGTDYHGEFLAWDTSLPFADAGSWTAYDPGANGVGSDPDGYFGGVFTGSYVVAIPCYNGTGYHGEFLRFYARKPAQVPDTVYGGSFF